MDPVGVAGASAGTDPVGADPAGVDLVGAGRGGPPPLCPLGICI
jgi:hypothetical protein